MGGTCCYDAGIIARCMVINSTAGTRHGVTHDNKTGQTLCNPDPHSGHGFLEYAMVAAAIIGVPFFISQICVQNKKMRMKTEDEFALAKKGAKARTREATEDYILVE